MRTALVILYAVAMPPAEFDHPYDGQLEIVYADPTEVSALCNHGTLVKSCARSGEGRCKIIFPKDVGTYPKRTLELLMRHEIAHCNGWRH